MTRLTPELWVKTWKEAGPRLEAIRREEIRRTDHVAVVAAFDGLLDYALEHFPPRPTSGLVEQQRLFSLARNRG